MAERRRRRGGGGDVVFSIPGSLPTCRDALCLPLGAGRSRAEQHPPLPTSFQAWFKLDILVKAVFQKGHAIFFFLFIFLVILSQGYPRQETQHQWDE